MTKESVRAPFIAYTKECLGTFATQSDQALVGLVSIVDSILVETTRIGKISPQSIEELKKIKLSLEKGLSGDGNTSLRLVGVLKALEEISKTYPEIDSILFPIVSSLRSQDRVTRRIRTMHSAFECWEKLRSTMDSNSSAVDRYSEFKNLMLASVVTDDDKEFLEDMLGLKSLTFE